MTLYWWNHWFWITTITVIFVLKFNYVFTFPVSPIEEIKEYNNKNLPISSSDNIDIDDVYMGQQIIPSQLINKNSNKIIDKNNNNNDEKLLLINNNKTIEDNLILNKNQSNYNNNLNNISDVIKLIPDTNLSDKLKFNNDNVNISKNINETISKTYTDHINLNDNFSILSTNHNKTHILLNESANYSQSNIMQIKKNSNINSTILSSQLSLQSQNPLDNNESTTTIIFDNSTANYDENDDIGNITKLDLVTTTTNSTDVTDDEKISTKLENVTKMLNDDGNGSIELEHVRKSKVLSSEYRDGSRSINFPTETKNLLTRSAADLQLYTEQHDDGNVSSEALQITGVVMDAGTISGICFAVFALCIAISMTGLILYRRRFLNKPQTLNEPDSSVYIDDSTIRDNSDEMYSLDNDSFLNSLEAMTIQNYWTDTVKHTKL